MASNNDSYLWWKHGVVYHIYPRSFFDSNGDGIGDIAGITEKLDYIADCGFDAVWLSPVNTSPNIDFGYDVSDYYNISPDLGTFDDFTQLIVEAHRRGIRIIMDMVINHSSNQHSWFRESASSMDNQKRDWYIWRRGKNGGPPNNWITNMMDSVWEFDPRTDEYYLHSFFREQPDLNWQNREVRNEIMEILKFWMNTGVDGFRLDMVNWLMKDSEFRNNPGVPGIRFLQRQIYNKNQKTIHRVLKKIRKTVDAFPQRMVVGEVFSLPPGDPELAASYMGDGDELHLAFDFSLFYRTWSAGSFYQVIKKWMGLQTEQTWPCHVLSNHDQKRSYSRLCRGKYGNLKAKLLATMLLTLKGTPFVYYGEEIGMKSLSLKKHQTRDPLARRFWPLYKGRDSSRLPMQWNDKKNGGFSRGEPWLPVDPEYVHSNVHKQLKDPDSLLNHYRALIRLRKGSEVLLTGDWLPVINNSAIMSWQRVLNNESMLVILNFSGSRQKFVLEPGIWKVVLSGSGKNYHCCEKSVILPPFESIVLEKK